MIQLFNTILYQPLYNLMIFLYNVVPGHDLGLAIILMTIIIKLILYPFSLQSIKAQKSMHDLQPKIAALKKQYKDQKEKLAQAMMRLYREEKISPFSSCLPLLIQFPFLIAVYRVFRSGLASKSLHLLYPFIHNPGSINSTSLGLIDLGKPYVILAILAGAAQLWQTRMMVRTKPPKAVEKKEGAKDEGMAAIMNKQMMYMMPVLTVIICLRLPSGLALYWFVTTLLMIAQQYYFFNQKKKAEAR